MISVYNSFNDDYDSNGDAVLVPSKCAVTEEAGAGFELSMTHPLDAGGAWKLVIPGAIIKAPIPAYTAKAISGSAGSEVWRVTTSKEIRAKPSEPTAVKYKHWMSGDTDYQIGDKVTRSLTVTYYTYRQVNFQCIKKPLGDARFIHPEDFPECWKQIASTTGGGKVLLTAKAGTLLFKLGDYNSDWARVCTKSGIEGYIRKSAIVYDHTISGDEAQARTVDRQLFRVYRTQIDSKAQTLTVNARHVSYDLNANLIGQCLISNAAPAVALALMKDALREPVEMTLATNLVEGTFSGDMQDKNGINALLDPDSGFLSAFDAELRRDNWDIFFYAKEDTPARLRLEYGVNLQQVQWREDTTHIITRVMPVAQDASGNDLYLQGDVFVDSDNIDLYPVHRCEKLAINQKVGGDDGEGGTWTTATLREYMRSQAMRRFEADKIDQPETEIKVTFTLLGDTEEYKGFKGLESLNIYDKVRVIDSRIGLDREAEVSKYEFDAINLRMNSITLGTYAKNTLRNIAGFQLRNGAIEINKLSTAAIKQLKGE